MKKIRVLAHRFPIISSIVCCALILIILRLTGLLIGLLPEQANEGMFLRSMLGEGITAACGVGLMIFLGYAKRIFSRREGFFSSLFTGGYFLFVGLFTMAYSVAMLSEKTPVPASHAVEFVLAMLFVGIAEESFCRGIMVNLLCDRYGKDACGIWFCTIVSGCIFGFMHLNNALSGAAFSGVLVQAIIASFMGMALGAIYIRTKNFWALVFIHAFIDFAALITSGLFVSEVSIVDTVSSYSALNLISILPYLIVILVLLRPGALRKITAAPSDRASKRRLLISIGCLGAAIVLCVCLSLAQTDFSALLAQFEGEI